MRNVLILQGGWEGHQPRELAGFFANKLSERNFSVEICNSLSVLENTDLLHKQDLIVPLWTCGTLTAEQEKNLEAVIRGGTGLAGFHGGMGDAFRGSILYQWMVGGQFVAHPDNIKRYTVKLVGREDPILRGLNDFSVNTEQYYMLLDPQNEVLATTTFTTESATWVNGAVMPVVWKKMHGLGRVFYSALGHQLGEFTSCPEQLEITLRGFSWAARS